MSKELVEKLPDYFLISIDDFDLVIERMEERNNERLIPVPTEHFFHRTIAMFSDKGVNLIIDQILHNDFTTKDCIELLHDYPVLFVGVLCPIEELERRERARRDRTIGKTKTQLEYVHQQNERYDVEVNTFFECRDTCTERILKNLLSDSGGQGWRQTYENNAKG